MGRPPAAGRPVVLVAGLEHVIDKQAFQSQSLVSRGVDVVYYTEDVTGHTAATAARVPVQYHKAPAGLRANLAGYLRLLRGLRPAHVELYFATPAEIRLGYVLLALLFRVPVVCICRGGEIFGWDRHRRGRRLIDRFVYRAARMVIVTEYKMDEFILARRIVPTEKLLSVHNRTRVQPAERDVAKERQVVLFLNSFKPWRHPELVVQAAAKVLVEFPETEFRLVGKASSFMPGMGSREQDIDEMIVELGLEGRVHTAPYTDDPWPHYEQAAVYLLPAEMVFCNFGLLEVMERGVPPIVADVPGAELVVEHGVSGLRVPLQADAIADAVIGLLRDEPRRRAIGRAARQAVIAGFDLEAGADGLLQEYRSRVWRTKRP